MEKTNRIRPRLLWLFSFLGILLVAGAVILIVTLLNKKDEGAPAQPKNIIGYLESAPGPTFDAESFTHLIWTSCALDPATDGIKFPDDAAADGFLHTVRLKRNKPGLKVLIGLRQTNPGDFAAVAEDPQKRAAFAKNITAFIADSDADGAEFRPETSGGQAAGFLLLLQELRKAAGKKAVLAMAAGPDFSDSAGLKAMEPYADFFNITSADFSAPKNLYASAKRPACGADLLSSYLKAGFSSSKLNLTADLSGLPIGESALPAGLTYQEISALLANKTYVSHFDPLEKACRLIDPATDAAVMLYEDTRSLTYKANYAVQYNLAGLCIAQCGADPSGTLAHSVYAEFYKDEPRFSVRIDLSGASEGRFGAEVLAKKGQTLEIFRNGESVYRDDLTRNSFAFSQTELAPGHYTYDFVIGLSFLCYQIVVEA